jgi:hypothetical protein
MPRRHGSNTAGFSFDTLTSCALFFNLLQWPAVFEEFVPWALRGTALPVIGLFATVKLEFQHFAECCPSVRWDESENVVGYADAEG